MSEESKIHHESSQKWMNRISFITLLLFASALLFCTLTKIPNLCNLSISFFTFRISVIRYLFLLSYDTAQAGLLFYQIAKLQYCFGQKDPNGFSECTFITLYVLRVITLFALTVSALVGFNMETGPNGCTFVKSGKWKYSLYVNAITASALDWVVFLMYCRRIC